MPINNRMNFKLYAESDTRRDFLKKLVGGAASVATGNLGKVASELVPQVIYLDLNKIANAAVSEIGRDFSELQGEVNYSVVNLFRAAIKGTPLLKQFDGDVLNNSSSDEFAATVEKLSDDIIHHSAAIMASLIKKGNLNVTDVSYLFEIDNDPLQYASDISKDAVDYVGDFQDVVFKFAKGSVPTNVKIGAHVISQVKGSNILQILNKAMSDKHGIYVVDQYINRPEVVANIADTLQTKFKSLLQQEIKPKHTSVLKIKLSKQHAQKVYNALNQLL